MPIRIAALVSAVLALSAFAAEELIFDFESPKQHFENADKLQYVPEHATQGKLAGKITLEGDKTFGIPFGFYGGTNMKGRWGEFDRFVIDVFVEGGTAKVGCYVKDKEAKSWDTRYNNDFTLAPGKRTLGWSLAGLNRQNNKGAIKLAELEFFSVWFSNENPKSPATLYFDNARLVKGTGDFEVKMLFSFEGNDAGKVVLEDWPEEFKGKSAMATVEEHASDGKKALRLESRAPAGNIQFWEFETDWSRYDTLAMDIFSTSENAIGVGGWIRSNDPKQSYNDRHNWERMLKPGFNTIKFAVGGLCVPGASKTIDVAKVVGFNIAVNNATVFIDNVRLIRGTEEIPVEGMKKFDFGPPTSALMPGFTRVSKAEGYDAKRGWGWLAGGEFARDFDIFEVMGRHRPPDDLCRDACMPTLATFAVDLPNGDYRVWMILAPPGSGWGSHFKHRAVRAEGKTVHDLEYNLDTFKAYEFRFQDAEDLPGDDLWEKYINVFFQPIVFDVAVADGQLSLEFDSFKQWGWTCVLNGLVIWPKAQETAAQKWLANLDSQRKEQYQSLHVEKLPAAPPPYKGTAEEQARGYVRFVHSPDRGVNPNSVPTADEMKTNTLELCASPGQYEDGCLGVYPLKDCGKLTLAATDLAGPNGATIPASSLKLLVTRYKSQNQTAVYVPLPKYLDAVPADGIAIKPGVTRSFWLIAQVPETAPAGAYRGQVKLAWANGKTDAVDVALTVWPIKLIEPDFPMSMFMMGPMQAYLPFDPTKESYWASWKEILEDARAHGLTSVDPLVNMPLQKIENGKAAIDFTAMDRFMEMAKAAGFRQELNGYGVGTGMRIRIAGDLDLQAEAKRFGVASYGELAKLYFDAVREHAKEKAWLPIAFCTDDEFIVHTGGAEKLASLHRVLQESAPGFHFVTFDSAFYNMKPEQQAEREKMLADIDTWGAGIHTPREAELAKKNNRRLWLYNTGMNRFTFGTYMFLARKKHGVSGFSQWVYNGGGTYGNFYLASHVESHYGVTYCSTRGLRTTPVWERIRAGCDDHRYLETAWQLIEKAKAANKGTAQAQEIEALLEKTFAKMTFGKSNADALAGEGRADNPLDGSGMESFRKSVAEGILKLQDALK
jgi:hypothetical protein